FSNQVNNENQVVGDLTDADGNPVRAFLFEVDALLDLSQVQPGYTIVDAASMNDHETIVGGANDGQGNSRAYVMTPCDVSFLMVVGGPTTGRPGQDLIYSVTFTNKGPGDATGVRVSL